MVEPRCLNADVLSFDNVQDILFMTRRWLLKRAVVGSILNAGCSLDSFLNAGCPAIVSALNADSSTSSVDSGS